MNFKNYKIPMIILLSIVLLVVIYKCKENFYDEHPVINTAVNNENSNNTMNNGNNKNNNNNNKNNNNSNNKNNSEVDGTLSQNVNENPNKGGTILGLQVNDTCLINRKVNMIVLSTRHLRQDKYKPEPIWTNDVFCVYRTNPIPSLNQSEDMSSLTEDDLYYSLGDVILFKDYPNYIKNFNEHMNKLCSPDNEQMEEINNKKENNQEGFENHSDKKNHKNNKNQMNSNGRDVLEPDSNISNYDQPGIKGLKYLVKNGKKPLGFSSNPLATIPKDNGENLYVWEPIAPEGYTFLGHATTIGVNPVAPRIDTCNIRAIPVNCLTHAYINEKDIVLSEDLVVPNRIYLVGNGKYIKGTKILSSDEKINEVSYDISPNCFYFERDTKDFVLDVYITYDNYKKDNVFNHLDSATYDLFKNEFELKFEELLLRDSDFNLNNFINNPDENSEITPQKRYEINSSCPENNRVVILLKIKHRAVGYNELLTVDLFNQIKKKICAKKFDFGRMVNMKVYNFMTTLEHLYAKVNIKDTKLEFEKIINAERPEKIFKTPDSLLGEKPEINKDGECSGEFGPDIDFDRTFFVHNNDKKIHQNEDCALNSENGNIPGLHNCLNRESDGEDALINTERSPKIVELKELINKLHRGSQDAYDEQNEYDETNDSYKEHDKLDIDFNNF